MDGVYKGLFTLCRLCIYAIYRFLYGLWLLQGVSMIYKDYIGFAHGVYIWRFIVFVYFCSV